MANRIPLIVNPDASQIQELSNSDSLIVGNGGLGVLGNCILGDSSANDTISLNSRFASSLIPSDTNRDLGDSVRYWNQAHVGTLNSVGAVVSGICTATTFNGHGVVPIGGIIMWSGKVSTIPSNFKLCDGNNNTPDLRNKFVIAAHSDQTVGVTTAAVTLTGSNTVSGGSKDATLPTHFHHAFKNGNSTEQRFNSTLSASNYAASGTGAGNLNEAYNIVSKTSEADVGKTSDEGSAATNANLPPYYALAFIMRVS